MQTKNYLYLLLTCSSLLNGAETPSFTQAPFVNPRIIEDLCTWLSDSGDQILAIDLTDSQDSNRYYPQENGFSYDYIGQSDSGIHVLRTVEDTEGTGIFYTLLLLRTEHETRPLIDWKTGSLKDGEQRVVLRKVCEVSLGDRCERELKLEGDRLLIGRDISGRNPESVDHWITL